MTHATKAPQPLPVGVTDYARVVEGGYWCADKTLLVRDIVDAGAEVTLFCRPRRFGKTLNMSMLRRFFEHPTDDPWPMPKGGESSTAHLFHDKAIWSCGERYTSLQGRYPVVSFTLKDLHYAAYADLRAKFAQLVALECGRHPELADSPRCGVADRAAFARLLAGAPEGVDLEGSLALLTRMLHAHWGVPAVVIVDEYDVPIQEGHAHGFYDDAVRLTRNWLSEALKDNLHLAKGFLTGILRVAKESIFSGLNNIRVDTVLDDRHASYFGLTLDEARDLLESRGLGDRYPELLEWYEGYRFGKVDVINPWSALNYVDGGCEPIAYWVDSSGNDIVGEVLEESTPQIREGFEHLLQGGTTMASVETSIVYPEIRRSPNSVWSFLLVTGYLTVRAKQTRDGRYRCELAIPNREVKAIFAKEVTERFMTEGRRREFAEAFSDALFDLDAPALEAALRDLLLASASFFDAATGEPFFHGLMLGLCAMAGGDYDLTSNREEGTGRYDLQMEPKRPERGLPGIVVEIKASRDPAEDLDALAQTAVGQVQARDYAAGMRSRGVARVTAFGAAFRGKEARVATAEA